ncbi:unnamed protein product [Parajaminaea phylloscopi]
MVKRPRLAAKMGKARRLQKRSVSADDPKAVDSPAAATNLKVEKPQGASESQPIVGSRSETQNRFRHASTTPPPSPATKVRGASLGPSSPSTRSIHDSPSARGKRTYGGAFRSHLAELPTHRLLSETGRSDTQDCGADATLARAKSHLPLVEETYAELRRKWVLEDGPLEPSGHDAGADTSAPPLKSLVSLRSTGSLKRFAGDFNFLLESLDPRHSLSARRTSALDVVTRLCPRCPPTDADHDLRQGSGSGPETVLTSSSDQGTEDEEESLAVLRQLKASSSHGKLWEAMRRAGAGQGLDWVLDWSLSIALHRLTRPEVFGSSLFDDGRGVDVWAAIGTIIGAATRQSSTLHEATATASASQPGDVERRQAAMLRSLTRLTCAPPTRASQAAPTMLTSILSTTASIAQLPLSPTFDASAAILPARLDGRYRELEVRPDDSSILRSCAHALHTQAVGAAFHCLQMGGGHEGSRAHPFVTSIDRADSHAPPSLDVLQGLGLVFESATGSLSGLDGADAGCTVLATPDAVPLLAQDVIWCLRYIHLVASQASPPPSEGHHEAWTTAAAWLKVLIIASQGNETWCRAIGETEDAVGLLVRLIVQTGTSSLGPLERAPGRDATEGRCRGVDGDVFCLALALLTNLLEHAPAVSAELSSLTVDVASLDLDSAAREGHGLAKHGADADLHGRPALLALYDLLSPPSSSWQNTAEAARGSAMAETSPTGRRLERGSLALAIGLALEGSGPAGRQQLQTRASEGPFRVLADALSTLTVVEKDENGSTVSLDPGADGEEEDLVSRMAAKMRTLHTTTSVSGG